MQLFMCFESRLRANLEIEQKYREFMGKMISRSEAELVTEPDGSGWYIPHDGIPHRHMPEKFLFASQ